MNRIILLVAFAILLQSYAVEITHDKLQSGVVSYVLKSTTSISGFRLINVSNPTNLKVTFKSHTYSVPNSCTPSCMIPEIPLQGLSCKESEDCRITVRRGTTEVAQFKIVLELYQPRLSSSKFYLNGELINNQKYVKAGDYQLSLPTSPGLPYGIDIVNPVSFTLGQSIRVPLVLMDHLGSSTIIDLTNHKLFQVVSAFPKPITISARKQSVSDSTSFTGEFDIGMNTQYVLETNITGVTVINMGSRIMLYGQFSLGVTHMKLISTSTLPTYSEYLGSITIEPYMPSISTTYPDEQMVVYGATATREYSFDCSKEFTCAFTAISDYNKEAYKLDVAGNIATLTIPNVKDGHSGPYTLMGHISDAMNNKQQLKLGDFSLKVFNYTIVALDINVTPVYYDRFNELTIGLSYNVDENIKHLPGTVKVTSMTTKKSSQAELNLASSDLDKQVFSITDSGDYLLEIISSSTGQKYTQYFTLMCPGKKMAHAGGCFDQKVSFNQRGNSIEIENPNSFSIPVKIKADGISRDVFNIAPGTTLLDMSPYLEVESTRIEAIAPESSAEYYISPSYKIYSDASSIGWIFYILATIIPFSLLGLGFFFFKKYKAQK